MFCIKWDERINQERGFQDMTSKHCGEVMKQVEWVGRVVLMDGKRSKDGEREQWPGCQITTKSVRPPTMGEWDSRLSVQCCCIRRVGLIVMLLNRTITPIRVSHQVLLQVFYSVEGETVAGALCNGPGELRVMAVKIPTVIPSVRTQSKSPCS